MGNAILLQFYEQNENPRRLAGGPGAGRLKEAMLLWVF
jgi:hypothetical protein